jgi:hypothetical protein
MRIVDPKDASSSWLVQRQRVTDPVRPTFVGRDALRHQLHPPTTADLRKKPVEVEEPQEGVIASGHLFNISDTDNKCHRAGGNVAGRPRHDIPSQ